MSASQDRKNTPNYYLALDIGPGASHNEILHAYNRSKMTYSNGSLASYGLMEGDSNVSILDEIEQAFSVLGNPSRRREYDMKMGYETWVDEDASRSRGHDGGEENSPSVLTTLNQRAPTEKSPAAKFPVRNLVVQPQPGNGKKVPENFEPNPEFEKQIQECKEVDGAFLKAVRIYRRMSVDHLAQACKLSSSHIEAIENEDSQNLHQPVYLRGHVYLMAQALDLPDPGNLAVTFVGRMKDLGKLQKNPF